jgi:cytochrome b subunit of formate dehydrogenase
MNQYLESVHGRALQKSGLTVAATCADCHGSHDVRDARDPVSTVNRINIPETCGKCHIGVTEAFAKSVHGELLAGGSKKAPVCSDCHTAHAISRTDTAAFKRDIVNECGSCHDKPKEGSREKASLYDTYRASYHGQVTALGSTRAARCSDCHGAHDIRRVDDALSPLNAKNKVQTCQKCHPGADAKFAQFAPHADFRNSARYPILHYVYLYFVIMMSASFGFFGLHCILWFVRSIIERAKHGPPHKPDYSKGAIQRFNRVDRVNHGLVIVTFFGLALTGLPLLYSDKAWAMNLAAIFGGPRGCGILHRVFAVMLIGNFLVHGVGVARRFKKFGIKQMLFGPTTMLPTKKDALDCLGMFKWFFLGGQKPKFDRWTYWEKFDYMAEVGGSGIIGLSGLFLWFPVFFSQYLPGWMFNVATVVHGFEALLAVGFIFTIHFFNAHLRLEKFPVDDVMFTGRLPEEEFKHERGAEYDRMVATGEIAKLRVAAPRAWYRHFAVFMGISAMAVGTTIVVLIILAALRII